MEEAVRIWQKLTEGDFSFSLSVHEELAKYHEHKRKDYLKALSFVDRAISELSSDPSLSFASVHQRKLDSLEYRKSRLERKNKNASDCAWDGIVRANPASNFARWKWFHKDVNLKFVVSLNLPPWSPSPQNVDGDKEWGRDASALGEGVYQIIFLSLTKVRLQLLVDVIIHKGFIVKEIHMDASQGLGMIASPASTNSYLRNSLRKCRCGLVSGIAIPEASGKNSCWYVIWKFCWPIRGSDYIDYGAASVTIWDSKSRFITLGGGYKSGDFGWALRHFKFGPSLQLYALHMNLVANWRSMWSESDRRKQKIAGFGFSHASKLLQDR